MTRKEKTATERAETCAARRGDRPAMTPRPPVPAAAHSAKVTSAIDGCSEKPRGASTRPRYAVDGHAGSGGEYRDHDDDREDDQNRRSPGQDSPQPVPRRPGYGTPRRAASRWGRGSVARGLLTRDGEAANHESRGEAAPGGPGVSGYAGRGGSLPRPELLTMSACPK